jgi:hypothetical protein
MTVYLNLASITAEWVGWVFVSDDAKPQPSEQRLKKILEAGADLAGATAGAAAGFVVAGPQGALGGAALGSLLKTGLEEVTARLLSRRELVRVGATCSYAAEAVREHLEAGETIREDGFFASKSGGSRSRGLVRQPHSVILAGVS